MARKELKMPRSADTTLVGVVMFLRFTAGGGLFFLLLGKVIDPTDYRFEILSIRFALIMVIPLLAWGACEFFHWHEFLQMRGRYHARVRARAMSNAELDGYEGVAYNPTPAEILLSRAVIEERKERHAS